VSSKRFAKYGNMGSGLEISLFAYRCLPYHLADGSIMNSQIIRNLFQSISMTHVSSIDAYISLCLRLLSPEYLIETRPAYIPLRTRNLLCLLLILQKILEFIDKSLFSQQYLTLKLVPRRSPMNPLSHKRPVFSLGYGSFAAEQTQNPVGGEVVRLLPYLLPYLLDKTFKVV